MQATSTLRGRETGKSLVAIVAAFAAAFVLGGASGYIARDVRSIPLAPSALGAHQIAGEHLYADACAGVKRDKEC